MAKKTIHQLTLSSTLMTLLCTSTALAQSETFSHYTYNEAKAKALQANKLLLIDFTASWCPPCKKMESSTWTDESVKAWLKENAVAIQVDVDEDKKTTSSLKVQAMPTIVLCAKDKNGAELGRKVGYMSPSELLRWLRSSNGEKVTEEPNKTESIVDYNTLWERISGARQMTMSKQYAEALAEYQWLWTNIRKDDSTFGELRMKMLPVEMKQLSSGYPEAKAKWLEMRKIAEASGDRADWILMNEILGDNAQTLSWFDSAKKDPKQLETIAKNSSFLESVLFSNCRWTDAANFLYPNPLAKINEYYKRAEAMKKPRPDTEIAADFDPLPSMISLVYGAYVGANREVEARKIADECLRLDNTTAMHTVLENMGKSMRAARAAQSKAVK